MATARHRSGSDRLTATCTAADLVGRFVYLSAPGQVRTVDIFDVDKVQTIGVIISKSSDTSCVVQRSGEVVGIFSGLTTGKRVRVNSTGGAEQTFSHPISGLMWVQWVGVATGPSNILLQIDTPFGVLPG